ncbi:MAG: hypothetical protein K6E27_01365 [Eubacterium sp.]|nr:hypothetical protein [Eubacterium sp.]
MNRFVFGKPMNLKKRGCHIAVWNVIKSCDIEESLEVSIKNVTQMIRETWNVW